MGPELEMEEGKSPRAQVQRSQNRNRYPCQNSPKGRNKKTKAKTTHNNAKQEATSCALLITECRQVHCMYK